VIKEYCREAKKKSLPIPDHLLKLRPESLDEPSPNELVMNIPGDRFRFFRISAETTLPGFRKSLQKDRKNHDEDLKNDFWTSDKSPIKDKIVVLGGTYRAARDVHATPVGQRAGMNLLASAIETELTNRGIRLTNHALAIAVDLLF